MNRCIAILLIALTPAAWRMPVGVAVDGAAVERCCCCEVGMCRCGCDPVDTGTTGGAGVAACACDAPDWPAPLAQVRISFDANEFLPSSTAFNPPIASASITPPTGNEHPPPLGAFLSTIVLLI